MNSQTEEKGKECREEMSREKEQQDSRPRTIKQCEIKQQAAEDTRRIVAGFQGSARKYRIYRRCLLTALIISCLMFTGAAYYLLDKSIPSVIFVRANEEQSFSLGVPAKAEVVSVSDSGESNIPKEAITIDLSRTVTMMTGDTSQYQMQVKLFGFLPFKQVGIRVIEEEELIPVGQPVGVYVKTKGILVVGTGEFKGADGREHAPAKDLLKSGDYILQLNGQNVDDKDEFMEDVEESEQSIHNLTIERDHTIMNVEIQAVENREGKKKLGVWIRDNAQGVGTLTYLDAEGNFGALGHGINDVDTGALMEMGDGTLYETEIIAIRKGSKGDPGEMTGMIVYGDSKILGDILYNRVSGIYGICNEKGKKLTDEEAIPIGLKQEITRGPATILCTVEGEPRYYDVEITDIHLDHDNINRGIEMTVMDKELLELTGGIIQGMSGSPIIQDGKLVGAVTHVLVNDPTRGYGIFIENMLEAAK